jgi:glycosyltransferase involved in cell wall biosynthesis
MVFSVFSHVQHGKLGTDFFAYSPYVNEMNIWFKEVSQVRIIAPICHKSKQIIDAKYQHSDLQFIPISSFSFISFANGIQAIYAIPKILVRIFIEMQKADHIHLRCPGNVGLLACLVQIFFPSKPKTVKYAGNWDPNAKQPLSYRVQKAILSSTFLTKNATVLVYGAWENQSENIVPFFTATYAEREKVPLESKELKTPIRFIFVGTLTKGKNVRYAIELIEKLNENGLHSELHIFGSGADFDAISERISRSSYKKNIRLQGNCNREELMIQYQKSHFLILASTEGWPKVVAEAMFWGCLPVATPVSCVLDMLDNGNRGVILSKNLDSDFHVLSELCYNEKEYQDKVLKAVKWSQQYTTDLFALKIKNLLHSNG